MSKAPSAILSDALTAFNRAATLAFTATQDQARKDVTQATSDARDARRERDDAINTLHASRLEEQAWKQEAGVWKAAAEQAELTVNHHLDTIAQLREEAMQWKNQCLRLEETSRQEAISWKEQFLRVEQERSKLARRVEELVAEQLSSSGYAPASAPYTPMVRYSGIGDLSASTRLQRISALDSLSPSLQERPPSKSAPSSFKINSSSNRIRPGPVLQLPTPLSENQRSARQRTTQETGSSGSTSNSTRQILVRRVQAVVEVPVKEESVDREGVRLDKLAPSSATNVASTTTSATASTSKTPNALPKITESSAATTRVKRKAATKRTYVEIDNDESEEGDHASHDSKQGDADEYQPVSDGDDELLMGVETNRKEVYGMKRVSKSIPTQKAIRPSPPTAIKKRKALASSKKSRPGSVASKP